MDDRERYLMNNGGFDESQPDVYIPTEEDKQKARCYCSPLVSALSAQRTWQVLFCNPTSKEGSLIFFCDQRVARHVASFLPMRSKKDLSSYLHGFACASRACAATKFSRLRGEIGALLREIDGSTAPLRLEVSLEHVSQAIGELKETQQEHQQYCGNGDRAAAEVLSQSSHDSNRGNRDNADGTWNDGGDNGGGGGIGSGSCNGVEGASANRILLNHDPVYSKYFNMLTMNHPIPAIKQKMVAEGLDPAILDLGPHSASPNQHMTDRTSNNNNQPPPLPATAAPLPGAASATVLLKHDPMYKRYFKMLTMHLPPAAVKQKMAAESDLSQLFFDPSVLDLDPGGLSPGGWLSTNVLPDRGTKALVERGPATRINCPTCRHEYCGAFAGSHTRGMQCKIQGNCAPSFACCKCRYLIW
jgi:hypothetical protein